MSRFDRRAENIIGNNFNVNTENLIHKHAVTTVKQCINGEIFQNFINYFEKKSDHNKATQNQKCLLRMPTVRLEFAKRGFYFQGVKLYNSLPIKTRQIQVYDDFLKKMKDYRF